MPTLTYREALREAMTEEMRRDDKVFVMGEDVSAYGGTYAVTKNLSEEFGEKRVRDTPIAESVIVGAGIGAAINGLRPVAELMTVNFSLLAMDQIVNHAAKLHHMFNGQMRVPLVIRTSAGWGQLGATHSQTFENYFAYVPGLTVVAPSTPKDAKGLLKAAIRSDDPVVFLEHSLLYGVRGEVPEGDFVEAIGKSQFLRHGKDVTIVSYSRMANVSMVAAEWLAKEGIDAEVVDLRTLRPLDMGPVLESVRKTNRAVVAEESWRSVGMGAEIAARIYEEAFDFLDAPVSRVAAMEVPVPYNRKLEREVFPDEQDIVDAVRKLVKK
ncbi:MAG TPA: alpha-ketoacid dehydrogenase subunit beta [Chloroflexota bacterium]